MGHAPGEVEKTGGRADLGPRPQLQVCMAHNVRLRSDLTKVGATLVCNSGRNRELAAGPINGKGQADLGFIGKGRAEAGHVNPGLKQAPWRAAKGNAQEDQLSSLHFRRAGELRQCGLFHWHVI